MVDNAAVTQVDVRCNHPNSPPTLQQALTWVKPAIARMHPRFRFVRANISFPSKRIVFFI